jgi:hypothetical protein
MNKQILDKGHNSLPINLLRPVIAIIKSPLFLEGYYTLSNFVELGFGGDEGDRTPGLGVANAALSQLSYIPNLKIPIGKNVREHILLIVLVSRNC